MTSEFKVCVFLLQMIIDESILYNLIQIRLKCALTHDPYKKERKQKKRKQKQKQKQNLPPTMRKCVILDHFGIASLKFSS